MHRNTLLFTIVLATLAAILIGLNVGRKFPTGSPAPTPTPEQETSTLLTFTSQECGITFNYPQYLSKLDGPSGSAVFTDPTNAETSVTVTCQAEIPRPPLPSDRIETLAIPGTTTNATISARLYHDASPKDGTPLDAIIFTHPKTGLDVFVAGFGPVFQGIIVTLKYLN
jgi:hypothetical protein